jgi:hypothetical protein
LDPYCQTHEKDRNRPDALCASFTSNTLKLLDPGNCLKGLFRKPRIALPVVEMESVELQEVYSEHGVGFRYPAAWELAEQRAGKEVTITVSSPETSFWSIVVCFDAPRPEDLIESALEAFRDEYEELDIYPAEASLCQRPTVARDLEFVCLELINSAFLRAFRAGSVSVLVLYQGTDLELEDTQETLEAISVSLSCDGGVEGEE